MAEILCAIDRKEVATFIPMRELSTEHCREVYEAAGRELYLGMAALGNRFNDDPGCFLVRIGNGSLVSFPFLVASLEQRN
jgi:hypothetical protein